MLKKLKILKIDALYIFFKKMFILRLIDLGPRVNNTELILPKKFKNSKSESNVSI